MVEKVLKVSLRAPVASFRRPLEHNYQRSLPIPPPTTILGIAGAALGLSDIELWKNNGLWRYIKVSAWTEKQPEKAIDLQMIPKFKAGKIDTRSPYCRELLFSVQYVVVYGGEISLLERLQKAFIDPAYPISLGRDDELAIVDELEIQEATLAENPEFSGTILPIDIRSSPSFRFIFHDNSIIEPPIVENLPMRFIVDPKKGIRRAASLQCITFLPYGVSVRITSIEAWQIGGRTFTWFRFGDSSQIFQPTLL